MPWRNPSEIVLYHGTIDQHLASITTAVDVTVGGNKKDFSRGFYTTTNFSQAVIHARHLRHRRAPFGAISAVVAAFTVGRDAIGSLTSMTFVLPNSDFWDLIDWCRAGRTSHHGTGFYDVVYGPVTEDFRNRTLHERYDQVSFHNAATVGVLGVPQWRIV